MRALASGALAVCALACNPGDAAEPRFEQVRVAPPRDFWSGERLKARYHVVDGVVEVFTTFHDVQLDADCAYDDESGAHVGPGASSFCFPAGMARHREGKGPYLDSRCTMAGAFTPSGGAAQYALVEPRNACTTEPEVHLAKPPASQLAYVFDDEGVCAEAGGGSVQAFAGVVPLDTFVRAVEQVESRPGRIGARMLVGSDGSRRVVGGFDRDRNESVRVGVGDDGTPRWLPTRVAFVGGGELLFSDAACGKSVATKIARTATCPLGGAVVLKGNCGSGSYFALGAPVSSLFGRDEASKCVARSAADLLAFELGPAISPSVYEPLVSTDIGTERVRRRGQGTSGDAPISWAELIDGETNAPCEVATTADGTLRCLPAATAVVAFFTNAECTETAVALPLTGCEAGASPRFVRDAIDVPPRTFEVGREIDAIYTQEGGGCRVFAPPVKSRMFAVREIDTTRFPTAVLSGD